MSNPTDLNRIGLFGGTFDPVHLGHIVLAEWVSDALRLGRIYFIPNFIHPFLKRTGISEAKHRLNMLQLAVTGFSQFQVSSIEIDRREISYAVDTIRYFRAIHPQSELYYLIGEDILPEFKDWKQPDEIIKLAWLVVFNRITTNPSFPSQLSTLRSSAENTVNFSFDSAQVIYSDNPLIDISSTQIRERIRNGQAFQSLVPAQVFKYIVDNKLYLDQE